jgi:hypothetical protein
MVEWMDLFETYEVAQIRHDEVVRGTLSAGLSERSPRVRALLQQWPGTHFAQAGPSGTELTLVRRLAPEARERWWVHLLLFMLAGVTTTLAGAHFLGRDALEYAPGPFGVELPVRVLPSELALGLYFSVPLLLILLAHELGHYLVARRHRMDVSPPYFAPAPHMLSVIGTLGAFIRLRSALFNRAMLLDVGAAGPLMSFILSVPLLALGLSWSRPLSVAAPAEGIFPASRLMVIFDGQPIWLGDSLLVHWMANLFSAPAPTLWLHPLALAAWLGLFVTTLNLLPFSQLDGGHILFALLGRGQRLVGGLGLGALLLMGYGSWGGWWGWWLWAGIALLLGRGRVAHPPVLDPDFRLNPVRRAVGWACVAILVITFVPVPIRL